MPDSMLSTIVKRVKSFEKKVSSRYNSSQGKKAARKTTKKFSKEEKELQESCEADQSSENLEQDSLTSEHGGQPSS